MSRKIKLKISSRLLRKKLKKNSNSSKKHCRFLNNSELIKEIDYKNPEFLLKFITERGKILPSRISGNSSKYQRMVCKEIKKARIMSLLPYSAVEY